MKHSESLIEISKALAKFQAEVSDPERTKENAFLKAKYVTLDALLQAVRPILAKNGISFLQIPETSDGSVTVTTRLLHESGEWIEAEPFTLPLVKKDPQGVGSVVTYGRRYSLSSILGVAWEEDDDANSNNVSEVTLQALNEVVELATAKGIEKSDLAKYTKATFNKISTQLDLSEIQQLKAWVNSY